MVNAPKWSDKIKKLKKLAENAKCVRTFLDAKGLKAMKLSSNSPAN